MVVGIDRGRCFPVTRFEILETIADTLHRANAALVNEWLSHDDRVDQARRWVTLARSYEVLLETQKDRPRPKGHREETPARRVQQTTRSPLSPSEYAIHLKQKVV